VGAGAPYGPDEAGQQRSSQRLVLELQQTYRVAGRIHEPRRQCKADVGDTIDGLQTGLVVVDHVDAARTQLGDLGCYVGDTPARLRLLFGAGGAGSCEDKSTVTAAPEGHEIVVLDQHVEPDPVAVELPHHAKIGSCQHHVDRVFAKHVSSFPPRSLMTNSQHVRYPAIANILSPDATR